MCPTTRNKIVQLVAQHCCVASYRAMLLVFPPSSQLATQQMQQCCATSCTILLRVFPHLYISCNKVAQQNKDESCKKSKLYCISWKAKNGNKCNTIKQVMTEKNKTRNKQNKKTNKAKTKKKRKKSAQPFPW